MHNISIEGDNDQDFPDDDDDIDTPSQNMEAVFELFLGCRSKAENQLRIDWILAEIVSENWLEFGRNI